MIFQGYSAVHQHIKPNLLKKSPSASVIIQGREANSMTKSFKDSFFEAKFITDDKEYIKIWIKFKSCARACSLVFKVSRIPLFMSV